MPEELKPSQQKNIEKIRTQQSGRFFEVAQGTAESWETQSGKFAEKMGVIYEKTNKFKLLKVKMTELEKEISKAKWNLKSQNAELLSAGTNLVLTKSVEDLKKDLLDLNSKKMSLKAEIGICEGELKTAKGSLETDGLSMYREFNIGAKEKQRDDILEKTELSQAAQLAATYLVEAENPCLELARKEIKLFTKTIEEIREMINSLNTIQPALKEFAPLLKNLLNLEDSRHSSWILDALRKELEEIKTKIFEEFTQEQLIQLGLGKWIKQIAPIVVVEEEESSYSYLSSYNSYGSSLSDRWDREQREEERKEQREEIEKYNYDKKCNTPDIVNTLMVKYGFEIPKGFELQMSFIDYLLQTTVNFAESQNGRSISCDSSYKRYHSSYYDREDNFIVPKMSEEEAGKILSKIIEFLSELKEITSLNPLERFESLNKWLSTTRQINLNPQCYEIGSNRDFFDKWDSSKYSLVHKGTKDHAQILAFPRSKNSYYISRSPLLKDYGTLELSGSIDLLKKLIEQDNKTLTQAKMKAQDLTQELLKISPLSVEIIRQKDGSWLVASNPLAEISEKDLELTAKIEGAKITKFPTVINGYQLLSSIASKSGQIQEKLQAVEIPKEIPEKPVLPNFQPKNLLEVDTLKQEIETYLSDLKKTEAVLVNLSEKASLKYLQSRSIVGKILSNPFLGKEEKVKREVEKKRQQQEEISNLPESKLLEDFRELVFDIENVIKGWKNTDIVALKELNSLVNHLSKNQEIFKDGKTSVENLIKNLSLSLQTKPVIN